MDTKQKLITISLILGTVGLILFLAEKMNIVKGKSFNYIGKALIVVGVYLLAIGSIITNENYDQLLLMDGNGNFSSGDDIFNSINSGLNNSATNVKTILNAYDQQYDNAMKLINYINNSLSEMGTNINNYYKNTVHFDEKIEYSYNSNDINCTVFSAQKDGHWKCGNTGNTPNNELLASKPR